MKKTFAIVALLVMVVSVVSAGSVYFDSGVSFSNGNRGWEADGKKYEKFKLSVVSLPLEIGYREAFDNGVIVSGSAGVFFNLSEKMNGNALDEKWFPTHFSLKAQAGYGMEINEKLAAEFLGGFSYAFGTIRPSDDYKESFSTITLTAEAGVKYEIADSITLRAGAKIGIPFKTTIKAKVDGASDSAKNKLYGFMFNITPFVGAAYQF